VIFAVEVPHAVRSFSITAFSLPALYENAQARGSVFMLFLAQFRDGSLKQTVYHTNFDFMRHRDISCTFAINCIQNLD